MKIKRVFDKILYSYRHIGLKGTTRKILDKLFMKKEETDKINEVKYVTWQQNNNLTNEVIESYRKKIYEYSPKISIVVPLYNTNEKYFEELINYIRMQTYLNWELCLADGSERRNPKFEDIIKVDYIAPPSNF